MVAAYARFNHLPEARKLLDKVLNTNRQDVEALLQKSEIELADGKLGDTQNDLSQVLHYRPDSAKAHFLMSRVHLARGDVVNRQRELAAALSLDPSLMQVRIELARCSPLAGRPGGRGASRPPGGADGGSGRGGTRRRGWAPDGLDPEVRWRPVGSRAWSGVMCPTRRPARPAPAPG